MLWSWCHFPDRGRLRRRNCPSCTQRWSPQISPGSWQSPPCDSSRFCKRHGIFFNYNFIPQHFYSCWRLPEKHSESPFLSPDWAADCHGGKGLGVKVFDCLGEPDPLVCWSAWCLAICFQVWSLSLISFFLLFLYNFFLLLWIKVLSFPTKIYPFEIFTSLVVLKFTIRLSCQWDQKFVLLYP